jgi:hypothetical protein
MDDADRQARSRDARRRLQSQRRRVGELRARAVAISILAFALLWGIVFVQMATGHDPVLGDGSRQRATHGAARDRISDTVRAAAARAAAAEAVETTEPDEVGSEAVEPEPVEPEPVEPEVVQPEPEPAPVITGQS